jgi:DNA cross-link repair 1C protein
VHEMGIGGGRGDIDQVKELEMADASAVQNLINLCKVHIKDEQKLARVVELIMSGRSRDGRIRLPTHSIVDDGEKLEQLVGTLVGIADAQHEDESQETACSRVSPPTVLPDSITFPYARHSSYSELCLLVEALRPLDVYPCTVDERNWTPRDSMQALFGHLCSGSVFRHDREMLQTYVAQEASQQESADDTDATKSASCTFSASGSQGQEDMTAGQDMDPTAIVGAQDIDSGVRSRTVTMSLEGLRTPPRKRRRGLPWDSSP